MDWMKIISALFLTAMIIFLWPRAKQMIKESPKGSSEDWKGAIIPLAAVVGFVILLVMMV
ncbi:MAG: hypothetical protein OQK78_11820 [Gammaproteobacteria bacterium]|nr:hypothetical protein [Gammaproteobacteria bacterium]